MTQPTATIIAACIAVTAALIAFAGVVINAWVTNRQHRERLAAERATRDRDEQIATATRKRDEAIAEVVAATEVAMRAWTLVGAAHNNAVGLHDATPWTPGEAQLALEECETADMRLAIFGLEKAQSYFRAYVDEVRKIWDGLNDPDVMYHDGPPGYIEANKAIDKMRNSFRTTVADLDLGVTAAASVRER